MIKQIFTFLFLILVFSTQAQESTVQMADTLRENGKIYIVITVIGIIFLALLCFLIYLERKVKKLEEKINQTPSK